MNPYKAPTLFTESSPYFFVTQSHSHHPPFPTFPVMSSNFATPLVIHARSSTLFCEYKHLLLSPSKIKLVSHLSDVHLKISPTPFFSSLWFFGETREGGRGATKKNVSFLNITYSMSTEWTFKEDERNRVLFLSDVPLNRKSLIIMAKGCWNKT